MDLVDIQSFEENNAIKKEIIQDGRYEKPIWLAGNDLTETLTFKWANVEIPVCYTDWRIGEPNGGGQCVAMDINNGAKYLNYDWIDQFCVKVNYYLCRDYRFPNSTGCSGGTH